MIKKLGTTPVRRAAVGGAVALGATALAIATVPAFADTDQPQPKASCEAEPLLEDEDIESIASAIDHSGSWAAGRVYQETGIETRLWNDGEVIALDVFGHDTQTFGINGHGTAVGVTAPEDAWSAPWAHHDGEIVEMAELDDGTEGWPRAINDDGVVVGYTMTEDVWKAVDAVRWDSVTAEPEVLPLPEEADSGAATAIDADGTVVGFYVDADGASHPYRWDADGNGEALPDPGVAAEANHIRDGWIAGEDTENETPLLWSPDGEVTEITELESANGVSGNGDIVGTNGEESALLTADGELVSLDGSGKYVGEINAGGDVIVGTADANGGNQSVVWRCS